jgi:hypothetical protein
MMGAIILDWVGGIVGIRTEGRFSLSFRLQRGLELLNGFSRPW